MVARVGRGSYWDEKICSWVADLWSRLLLGTRNEMLKESGKLFDYVIATLLFEFSTTNHLYFCPENVENRFMLSW